MKKCFYPADILLPSFALDAEKMCKWSCIACDQYTSEPEYWDGAEKIVGDEASTLRIMLPELLLDESEKRIPEINSTMKEYTKSVLIEHLSSMIYLERTLKSGKVRRGLIGAVDLECYDYNKGATSLIRATEGTVLERIPPRVKIREGASIELPHIMILIDDVNRTVIEPLAEKDGLAAAYDFELMQSGGHVKGCFVPESEQARISEALDSLCVGESPLLFAVGDGNHSLASAKAFWEQIKSTLSESERENHPARYALAEIVNIHDEALEFEPIYRVVFGAEPEKLIDELKAYAADLPENDSSAQIIEYITADNKGEIVFDNPTAFLPVGTLQTFLDKYIAENPSVKIDYIHGVDSTEKLAKQDGAVGFIFRGMEKSDLFPTVISDGALPRKTFSMGEADDKRFYLEARKIVK
ncbi:MAG: DUF1015 domain-containing protein [Clostridiales bacterium]|nr:DUF1015 domain-containing protein [Clostridiales bacterium]